MRPTTPKSTRTDTLCPYNDALPFSDAESSSSLSRAFSPPAPRNDFDLGLGELGQAGHHYSDLNSRHAAGSRFLTRRAAWCRSEEHTSELQSLMRRSCDVFCLVQKTTNIRSTMCTQLLHYLQC